MIIIILSNKKALIARIEDSLRFIKNVGGEKEFYSKSKIKRPTYQTIDEAAK